MNINYEEELAWSDLEQRTQAQRIQNIASHCDTVLFVLSEHPQDAASEAWLRDELRELHTQLNHLQQLGYFL